jgi:hypothetical protein
VYVDKVLLGVLVQLPEKTISDSIASPGLIGAEIAASVDDYVRENELGYYPALTYFRDNGAIDAELIHKAEQLAWRASKHARELIQTGLRPIFSTVRFRSVQPQAFLMPTVRPGQPGALKKLSQHYSPDIIRLELVLSLLRKDNDSGERSTELYARKMIYRWLREPFEMVEVTSSSAL